VPGRGSGIFLHVSRGNPTVGCVSLPEGQLLTILRWLRPAKSPLIVIGTRKTIRKF
jgi:L,D-peptidoglycan transpeptidase YkuD (ErfK/YbiS/YcfS/YnhG family)